MSIVLDARTFSHAGSTLHNGTYKARFANHPAVRTKILTGEGHTEIVLVELPTPMSKLEAIAWLKENKPAGVNLASLDAKENYINNQIATITKQSLPKTPKVAKVPSGRKRGRPRLSDEVKAARLAAKRASNPVKSVTPVVAEVVPTVATTSNPVVTSIVSAVKKSRSGSIRAKAASVAAVATANTK